MASYCCQDWNYTRDEIGYERSIDLFNSPAKMSHRATLGTFWAFSSIGKKANGRAPPQPRCPTSAVTHWSLRARQPKHNALWNILTWCTLTATEAIFHWSSNLGMGIGNLREIPGGKKKEKSMLSIKILRRFWKITSVNPGLSIFNIQCRSNRLVAHTGWPHPINKTEARPHKHNSFYQVHLLSNILIIIFLWLF